MRKYDSLAPLERQLMVEKSFGTIRRQAHTFDRNASSKDSNSNVLCRVNKYPLIPKKPIFFTVKKQQRSPQIKKFRTIQNQSVFYTEVPPFDLSCLRKQSIAGTIVNQSRAISRRLEKEQEKDRRDKLGQLYRKKSDLMLKMKQINSALRVKTQPLKQLVKPAKSTSLVVRKQKMQQESRSYFSRNSRYLGANLNPSLPLPFSKSRKSQKSPDSVTSVEKNQKVLSFIRKMNNETMKRDASRLSKFHKNVESQLKDQLDSLKRKDKKGHRCSESTHFDSLK